MLEPRQTDLPALFLVLVVLPMVAYVLLGKWSETSKKKEKISLLAQLAAEEALRAETMAAAAAAAATAATTVIPLAPVVKNTVHECARCYAPATTRCSQCKSVRYCSGKCQIIHWRLGHKQECQQLENTIYASSPRPSSASGPMDGRFSHAENTDLQFSRYNNQSWHENSHSDSAIHSPVNKVDSFTVTPAEKRKSNKEALKREDGVTSECSEEPSKNGSSREAHKRHKQKNPKKDISPTEITVDPGNSCGTNVVDIGKGLPSEENLGFASKDETEEVKDHSEKVSSKRGHKDKNGSHVGTKMYKSPKSTTKASREPLCSDTQRKGQIEEVARVGNTIPLQGNGGVASMGIMKMIGLMKSSKHDKKEPSEVDKGRHKKIKMLFPYEEFVKLFQYEVFDLIPRGLINCGNSCYANAVLQCLTCTKPLTIYLLRRSHSRACSGKDWCLMCELEQHVMMMRESEGPLSLSRMLLQMRSINCQIGDGSQEDAHEFLRILVTSMQSICLEGLGGEDAVGPKLQETTFIQHIFRGRLRSKVKCLKCRHESARYENIMDLTLEIYGWVESLEDALTQFTSPEDLDGENMYRCGRCAAYVRAQKQLSIQEAPNILTIVLKRFQEGSYGKINKCISFPEMLDMIPFMTGTDDIPPLYMLYAVVVHLDTLNASFSGHYISYVKDLQGNWFRIDDTEVQLVTVNHVMSEGAYILFYARSSPRLTRTYTGKPARPQPPPSVSKHWTSKTQKSSTQEQINHTCNFSDNRIPRTIDFSDVASSDWSIFTSSDDASFTTESTRDSFSTVDYADPVDPISSIFNGSYPPVYSRFGSEGKNCGVYAKNEGGQQDGPLRNSGFCKF